MKKYLSFRFLKFSSKFGVIFILVCGIVFSANDIVSAQSEQRMLVQNFTGSIFGEVDTRVYELSGLLEGEKVYAYVQGISGNLDPFIGLLSNDQLSRIERGEFDEEVQQALENDFDPLLVVSEFADRNFLAWDDESGGGFSAALEYTIPEDGDYFLAVISSPFTESFGDYQLTVGLNAPQALTGNAGDIGRTFVLPTSRTETRSAAVQEVTANLSQTNPENRHRLVPFQAGDSLYVNVETTAGDLIPQVVLLAYGTKPIRSANIAGNNPRASLDYTFPRDTEEYFIGVFALPDTSGSYKLTVGRNEPAVLVGEATPIGEPLLHEPLDVSVGVKLQQIANIDQKAENYEAVASTLISWNDPALAFRPDECKCENKLFVADDFQAFVTQESIIWPAFTYLNQQNNRWIQNDYVLIEPNGDAVYFERFTTTFQAPDFDFRRFPFDNQTFYIRIDSLFSTEYVNFVASDFTEVGTQLGEEEWYITDYATEVITEPSSTGQVTSSFIFRFFASRNLSFYIFRIFIPLLLILSVTWITFFMEDFGKRVDATTANLLLFIAFNFTIASELPRLGYLTYMDTLLVGAFFISVLVVIFNVFLKRQENREGLNWARRIDKYMIWLYPLGYLITFLGITWYFFWR